MKFVVFKMEKVCVVLGVGEIEKLSVCMFGLIIYFVDMFVVLEFKYDDDIFF